LYSNLGDKKPVVWTGDLNVAYYDHDVYDGAENSQRQKSREKS
jgi:exonuclease III